MMADHLDDDYVDGLGDEGFGGEEGEGEAHADDETGEVHAAAEGEDGDGGVEDPELEAIKARVKEMEEEAEKLKEMQSEVEKQMNLSGSSLNESASSLWSAGGLPTSPTAMSLEEKIDADARSIWVGNVDYGATAEELEAHFHGCGSINRVTILCDKFTGHPKGFAYVEFTEKDSVVTAEALDESLFRGRQIKVVAKRTNRPGISTTNRPPRGRGRRPSSRGSSYYYGYQPRPRGRYRRRAYYSPY